MATIDFQAVGLNDTDVLFLAMYFHDGCSYREIAQFFGICKQSAKDRIDKCIRKFRSNNLPMPKRMQSTTKHNERYGTLIHDHDDCGEPMADYMGVDRLQR